MNKREKQLQKNINYFLSHKLNPFDVYNINMFKRIFEPFKIKNNLYLLDGLNDEQRKSFIEYYIGYSGGGGTYTFGLDISKNIYRIEFRNLFGNFILIEKSYENK